MLCPTHENSDILPRAHIAREQWLDGSACAVSMDPETLYTIWTICPLEDPSRPKTAERSRANCLRKPAPPNVTDDAFGLSRPRYRGSNPCLPASLRSPAASYG